MHPLASLWLVAALAGLFLGLGWIARRFFYAPGGDLPLPVHDVSPLPARGFVVPAPVSFVAAAFRRPALRLLSLALVVVAALAALTAELAGRLHSAVQPPSDTLGELRLPFRSDPEVLVTPPRLPPSSFIAAERPTLESADRDWARLRPHFARVLLRIAAKMEQRGYPVVLIEGYRSPERQDALADGGNRVTRARGFQSRHQYGLAADLAPLRDGRIVMSERDPWAWQAYQALGEEVEAAGLVWGGRWSLRDYGHVETQSAS